MSHNNPGQWAADSSVWTPDALHAGAYLLPPALVARLRAGVLLPLANLSTSAVCADAAACAWRLDTAAGGGLYYGASPAAPAPAIGDLRVSWAYCKDTSVSVVGVQRRTPDGGATLSPYTARSGHTCFLLEEGLVPASAMIALAKARNASLTWTLRCLGCVMNYVGILLFLAPLGVALDLVPLVGPFISDLLSFGVGIVAAGCSLALCSLTIALAWLAVRPAIGVPLLLLSIAVTAAGAHARNRRRRQRAGSATGYSTELMAEAPDA